MKSLPTVLTPAQAEQLAQLLLDARRMLRDAAGPLIYLANYVGLSARIGDALRELGVDCDRS